MAYNVVLTEGAARDLGEIYEYLAEVEVPGTADAVLDKFAEVLDGLARFPERGGYPKELLELGIRVYREVRFKPYRVNYQVIGKRAIVMLIADGRRDMQHLLQRRLLEQ